jgi:hypothetical protein
MDNMPHITCIMNRPLLLHFPGLRKNLSSWGRHKKSYVSTVNIKGIGVNLSKHQSQLPRNIYDVAQLRITSNSIFHYSAAYFRLKVQLGALNGTIICGRRIGGDVKGGGGHSFI